jgi:hypothetical protein
MKFQIKNYAKVSILIKMDDDNLESLLTGQKKEVERQLELLTKISEKSKRILKRK